MEHHTNNRTQDTAALLAQLAELGQKHADGHFTIMGFTTNYRACVGTPESRSDVQGMPKGTTLEDALEAAVNQYKAAHGEPLASNGTAANTAAGGEKTTLKVSPVFWEAVMGLEDLDRLYIYDSLVRAIIE